MRPRTAVIMAAIFNLLGVMVMGSAVANTISKIINFNYDPGNPISPTLILLTLWRGAILISSSGPPPRRSSASRPVKAMHWWHR